jgi:hypothetical protein
VEDRVANAWVTSKQNVGYIEIRKRVRGTQMRVRNIQMEIKGTGLKLELSSNKRY